jgi:DNA-3-methyladenine glycosylase I
VGGVVAVTARRCAWASASPAMVRYHDREWGVPLHDDRRLFELLILEGAQAGLSWSTILAKRDAYRRAFARFDPRAVARFSAARTRALLRDEGIVRNRAKIAATVLNARAFLAVQRAEGTFDAWLWRQVGGRPIQNRWRAPGDVPAVTDAAHALSRELKARGFRFVGPTICYAFMQATGMVNDHLVGCFRRREVERLARA